MGPGESNFLIIDKRGVVRYSLTGKIDSGQFGKIIEILWTARKDDNVILSNESSLSTSL